MILDDKEWQLVTVTEGQIIEVHMGSSPLASPDEVWAAFYVLESSLLTDGSIVLLVRFLGCELDSIGDALARSFNPGPGRIHLCTSRPCLDASEEEKLHVTRIRLWTESDFLQGENYAKENLVKMIPAWKKLIKGRDKPPREPSVEKKDPPKRRRGNGTPKPKATPKAPSRSRRKPPAGESGGPKDRNGPGK